MGSKPWPFSESSASRDSATCPARAPTLPNSRTVARRVEITSSPRTSVSNSTPVSAELAMNSFNTSALTPRAAAISMMSTRSTTSPPSASTVLATTSSAPPRAPRSAPVPPISVWTSSGPMPMNWAAATMTPTVRPSSPHCTHSCFTLPTALGFGGLAPFTSVASASASAFSVSPPSSWPLSIPVAIITKWLLGRGWAAVRPLADSMPSMPLAGPSDWRLVQRASTAAGSSRSPPNTTLWRSGRLLCMEAPRRSE
mmetsp:Transcript_65428/g.109600  ORF Transcript_65428/g.109600 Transcript_65428/m.109600 type:complete len:255 (+) Transcript_65428:3429-4193(+)